MCKRIYYEFQNILQVPCQQKLLEFEKELQELITHPLVDRAITLFSEYIPSLTTERKMFKSQQFIEDARIENARLIERRQLRKLKTTLGPPKTFYILGQFEVDENVISRALYQSICVLGWQNKAFNKKRRHSKKYQEYYSLLVRVFFAICSCARSRVRVLPNPNA